MTASPPDILIGAHIKNISFNPALKIIGKRISISINNINNAISDPIKILLFFIANANMKIIIPVKEITEKTISKTVHTSVAIFSSFCYSASFGFCLFFSFITSNIELHRLSVDEATLRLLNTHTPRFSFSENTILEE